MKNQNNKQNFIQMCIIKSIYDPMCSDIAHFDTSIELATDDEGG